MNRNFCARRKKSGAKKLRQFRLNGNIQWFQWNSIFYGKWKQCFDIIQREKPTNLKACSAARGITRENSNSMGKKHRPLLSQSTSTVKFEVSEHVSHASANGKCDGCVSARAADASAVITWMNKYQVSLTRNSLTVFLVIETFGHINRS